MAGDYSMDPEKRNLRLEARAHIEVQQVIDAGRLPFPVLSTDTICQIHKDFCHRLPDELLVVRNQDSDEQLVLVPGELRTQHVKLFTSAPLVQGLSMPQISPVS
jgi:hypothetical protein